ncbi:hypothetical protein GGS23DRAFT_601726 [Durotheca rogersii]|uniref:uncharacterized protein n=1 Tax=Durotheca rogersii TaxID=419775 RepID=UPI00221F0048|nr:uncharacterized protein GGS23DRAFT_601726 [Durotheca rogersii]KAI5853640.1 hypothetical protein GGS23DRAFT_601726 [Durotheca rogersii]
MEKPQIPPGWVNSILRYKYNDGEDIVEGLKKLFGDKFILKHRNDRWIIWAERKLTDDEKRLLDTVAHIHHSS